MAVETYSVKPLGDVLRFKNGKSIKPETEGEFPAYGSNGLIGGSPEYREENTIIIGRVGAYCGSVAFCPGKFWASDNTIVAYPKDDAFDIRFLSYLLRDLNLNRWAGGAAQPLLTQTVLKQIEAPVPELRVQQKIAAILSAYDDLIENNLRRIKILEEMARNLYREWFVKFRFPCHAKVRMVDSPLGKIPEGWEVVTLGELVNIPKGENITKKTIVPGDVPVVAGGIAPAYYHNAANTRNPVITISASGANAGFVNLYYHDVWASDCSVIDLSATKHVYYFYLLLKDRQYEVTRLQRGAAQPHVYPKDLMALDALSVPEEILEFFARKIGPIFKMIKNMKEKNKNLHQTRDLLLPKLISGELDISELEIDTGKEAA
ncbi:restriction endonuclease subunit S [Thiolapillus sp.]|uniref:restriction endonuclease subunit S n=1 Tax=Thiolapillus sp. TaxID=2017437 RepID=UPI0025E12D8B|nr:restriction endonuclease subunit S [Thiolapillus sp.]